MRFGKKIEFRGGGGFDQHPAGEYPGRLADCVSRGERPWGPDGVMKPVLDWVFMTGETDAGGKPILLVKRTTTTATTAFQRPDGTRCGESHLMGLAKGLAGDPGLTEEAALAFLADQRRYAGMAVMLSVKHLEGSGKSVIGAVRPLRPGEPEPPPWDAYERPPNLQAAADAAGGGEDPGPAADGGPDAVEPEPPAAPKTEPPPRKTAAEIAAEQAERAASKGWSKPRPSEQGGGGFYDDDHEAAADAVDGWGADR